MSFKHSRATNNPKAIEKKTYSPAPAIARPAIRPVVQAA